MGGATGGSRGSAWRDRRERGVVHPPQPMPTVQRCRGVQCIAVGGVAGTHDQLRALTRGGEARRGRSVRLGTRGGGIRSVGGGVDPRPNRAHRLMHIRQPLLRRQLLQIPLPRKLHIRRQPIRMEPRPLDQLRTRARHGLEVDVAVEAMHLPKPTRHLRQLLHRIVGTLNDPRRQKQTFNIVPPIKSSVRFTTSSISKRARSTRY